MFYDQVVAFSRAICWLYTKKDVACIN